MAKLTDMNNMNNKRTTISLFSGAGGLDIGLERSGFETISMCELEPRFADTLRKNQGWRHSDGYSYFTAATIHNADVRSLHGQDLSGGRTIDCVIGGPPCQSFSSSGNQLGTLDPRGQLVHEYVRVISEIAPEAFVFENVRGIVTARDHNGEPGGVIRDIFDQLQSLGYSCRAALLNSANYGSFQRRVRCFIIGTRHGTAPHFPEPTHAPSAEIGLFTQPWRSLEDFLQQYADEDPSNYVFPSEALAAQLDGIPGGSGLKSAGASEPTRPGGHWGYRQGTFIADLALPARTVTGSASQDWIRWNGRLRRLTLLEIKRLQGFPDDWVLCGSKSNAFKQVGNAVPTVFGKVIGAVVREHLESSPRTPPGKLPFPDQFLRYIDYTVTDHARNASARKVHLPFSRQRIDASHRTCGT